MWLASARCTLDRTSTLSTLLETRWRTLRASAPTPVVDGLRFWLTCKVGAEAIAVAYYGEQLCLIFIETCAF